MDQQGSKPPHDSEKNAHQREQYACEHNATGRFIFPEEDTWAAHAQRVKTEAFGIGFDPHGYSYFDGIVAQKSGIKALHNPKDKDYEKYQALRDNIAVLRNFVLTHYEDTGRFQQGTHEEMHRIESIAEAIGNSLANDNALTRALTQSNSIDVANIDGVGASEIYKYLLEQQESHAMPEHVVGHFQKIKTFFMLPNRDWHLPKLEDSPFSPAKLAAPPPGFEGTKLPTAEDSGNYDTDNRQQDQHNSEALCEDAIKTTNALYSIDTLAKQPHDESIEEARKILRLLRNLEFTEHNMEEFLDKGTPSTQFAKKEAFTKLIDIFAQHHQHATRSNPALRNDPIIEQARDTASTIALELTEHTRKQRIAEAQRIKDAAHTQHTTHLNKLIDSVAVQSELRIPQSVDRLLDTLELGIQHINGKELDTKNFERLSTASLRTHKIAMQLHKQEELDKPTRQESVAHARQLLQELSRIIPPTQTLHDFAQNASLQKKIEFTKQVDELVEMYRNIMAEALEQDPTLSSNPVIKDANDAVGGFSSGIKLMASKEIPNSLAAAQQISADITKEPQAWKQLHHRTVDRLIKSAESGLEKAIHAVEQDVEEANEGIDVQQEAMMHDAARTRRRRGGDMLRSAKGFKKQLKKMLELSADDKHLKQGRFNDDDDEQNEGKDVAKAQARRMEKLRRKAILDIQADDYALKQGRFSQGDEPEIQSEGKDILKAQARKQDKQHMKQLLDTMADDKALGQGRFSKDRDSGKSAANTAEAQRRNQQQTQMREQQLRQQQQLQQQNIINQQVKAALKLNAKDMADIQKLGGSLRNMSSQVGAKELSDMGETDKIVPDDRDFNKKMADRDTKGRGQGSQKS